MHWDKKCLFWNSVTGSICPDLLLMAGPCSLKAAVEKVTTQETQLSVASQLYSTTPSSSPQRAGRCSGVGEAFLHQEEVGDVGRFWACRVGEGLGSGTGAKWSRKVFHLLRQSSGKLNSHLSWGRAEWYLDRAGLGSHRLWLSCEWSPLSPSGKWISSSGTGYVWHEPSGPDNCALGGSRQEPWPKGAVGRPGEAVGGERLQQGLWKEASPSKALLSVHTVRQDLLWDNIFPHCDSPGRRCKRGLSKALLRGSLPN